MTQVINQFEWVFTENSLFFPGGTNGKEPSANAGDLRVWNFLPGFERSPGEGNGNPLVFLAGESHGRRSL